MSGNLQLLAGTLARAKRENRAALIAGMTAGFPTVDEGIAAIQAILNSGADIVEVGLPHSDPVLDGPVIQAAGDIALRGGVRIADVIRTVREAYQATGKPVLVMSYWNPIDRYGVERFSRELAGAGSAGCILPDLPVQESALWRESAARHSLATVFVAAPSTTDERLRELTAAGTGFVYASSLMGVTGVRETLSTAASSLVRRIRATTELPVCVGVGISDAAQAAQVAGFADGVIVASALVKAILGAPDAAAGAATVAEITAELSLATHRQGDQQPRQRDTDPAAPRVPPRTGPARSRAKKVAGLELGRHGCGDHARTAPHEGAVVNGEVPAPAARRQPRPLKITRRAGCPDSIPATTRNLTFPDRRSSQPATTSIHMHLRFGYRSVVLGYGWPAP